MSCHLSASISRVLNPYVTYRHARLDNRPLAQLLQMDGPRREVVQRGNEISYFEPGLQPEFTLNGDYIVDSLPSLISTSNVTPYYDFISVGRTRICRSAL